jgi:plastocyanin
VKINKSSKGIISIAVVVVLAVTTVVLGAGSMRGDAPAAMTQNSFDPMSDIEVASTSTATNTTSTDNIQQRVAVGGGNLTMSINQFSPPIIQIQPGQSVNFYAPSGSTELHNVVFDLSNGTAISSVELAFMLPSGFSPDTLQLAPPDNFGEPLIQNMTDSRQAIVALNKVLFHPSAVSQNGDATYLQERELIQQMEQGAQQGLFMPPSLSASYTMQGTEVIVSSGLILDVMGFTPLEQEQGMPEQAGAEAQQQEPVAQAQEGSLPPAYPILSNFTMTFNEPGAYQFFCAFHPGMAGVVNVVDVNANASQNPTGA